MGALLAAVELGIAFGAISAEINIRGQRRRAIETPRCRDVLHESRKPGTGDVQGRPRPLGPGTVFAEAFALPVRVHIPVLSVLAIAVHGEGLLRNQRTKNVCEMGRASTYPAELQTPLTNVQTPPTAVLRGIAR